MCPLEASAETSAETSGVAWKAHGVALTVARLESTDLFVGTETDYRQVLRVHLRGGSPERVTVVVDGSATGRAEAPGDVREVEVPLDVPPGSAPGAVLDVRASVLDASGAEIATKNGALTVGQTGWTMWMVSHFHYDPVWWNTQAAYTSEWDLLPDAQSRRSRDQMTGFDLVDAHLDMALAEPEYTFVLAELDYLKPYWDSRPQRRAALRELMAAGRVELVGGTYNEPNTNLTGPETAIRTLVYGVGWQRDVLARGGPGSPATAWQLDVFGHDPQFPSMVADAGLTSTSWARGPHHQWGLLVSRSKGGSDDARVMQFASEFEWIGPDGKGVLTSYMPGHYSAGWDLDSAATLEQAMRRASIHFDQLKTVALTKNVLLPVGTDYTPPAAWIVGVHREWAQRYVWPRFVCGLPHDFFAAVRAELSERGITASPQSRDMNPVYTGKDVSFIDTKQAQRATENAVGDAEKLATLACLLGGARYPTAALDKAWRQLAFGAHHDAITGSESDEVYLDLLTDWRDAHDLGVQVRDRSAAHLLAAVDTAGSPDSDAATGSDPAADAATRSDRAAGTSGGADAAARVVVVNTSSWTRTEIVEVAVADPAVTVLDAAGTQVPAIARTHAGGATLSFLARDVPQVGWRTHTLAPAAAPLDGWLPREHADGEPVTIANEHYTLTVDPARGGTIISLVEEATGRELVRAGRVANELVVYEEYSEHPSFGEGPWHLIPSGASVGSAAVPASSVSVESSALGQRVTVTGVVDEIAYTSELTLFAGVDRVDVRTWVDSYGGTDRLVRVRFALDVPGTRPVAETGAAVIGRGFGFPDVDSAAHPWTLDNPAHRWFGVSATARVQLPGGYTPFGVAEVVVPGGDPATHGPALGGRPAQVVRELVVALARAGVTATTSAADGPRYGWLVVDSNLPDVRIAVGGPAENPFVAALADAVPELAAVLARAAADGRTARVWVPAEQPLAAVWVPDADLRDARALPVLVIAGPDPAATLAGVEALVEDLADAVLDVTDVAARDGHPEGAPDAAPDGGRATDVTPGRPHSVALLNKGIPGFTVDVDTALHLSLLRSCSGWPSGTWIDPPRRTVPDGSNFQHQHWSHVFEYALASGPGDWRDADLVRRAASYDGGLLAVVTDAHGGTLPGTHSMLQVLPEGVAELGALKPAGNPLAHGSGPDSDPRSDGVTVRLYEPSGRPGRASVTGPGPFATAVRSDVLETPREEAKVVDGAVQVDLSAYEITTLTAQLVDEGGPGGGDAVALGPDAEPVQPVPSRYWLHDSGPAPLGYQTLSVHLDPPATRLSTDGGADGDAPGGTPGAVTAGATGRSTGGAPEKEMGRATAVLTVTVSSDRVDVATPVTVTVRAPAPFVVDPADRVLELSADGWTRFAVRLSTEEPTTVEAGAYVVEVSAGLPDGQTGYDTALVWVGEPGTEPLLAVGEEVEHLRLAPGGSATTTVTVTNRSRSTVTGQLAVISPWGAWPFIATPQSGFTVGPGAPSAPASVELPVSVTIPPDTRPGTWWLAPKVMALGRVLFAPTVGVEVT